MGNLDLWASVEKTPPEHTKAITGKAYKGTSPKPHYLIHKATETFGPCGIGWGFTVDERVEDGAMLAEGFFERMHIAKVTVWYRWNGERGEVSHIGGTPFSGRRSSGATYTDEDAPKKSVTDALVKALSMIGFAGDIFMGRYDDSKYVSELREEADNDRKQAAKPRAEKSRGPGAYKTPAGFERVPGERLEEAQEVEAVLDALFTNMQTRPHAKALDEWARQQKAMIETLPDAAFDDFRSSYLNLRAELKEQEMAA